MHPPRHRRHQSALMVHVVNVWLETWRADRRAALLEIDDPVVALAGRGANHDCLADIVAD